MENPQIEIEEIKEFGLDATVVAEAIVSQLERFGTQRFKGIGHKMLESVMRAGALGVEILISGKIPSSRAKTWRFAEGYMKKCGDIAITGVNSAKEHASLKTGIVGVQVRIMPGSTVLPDQIKFDKRDGPVIEEVETKIDIKKSTPKSKKTTESKPKKKATKKKTAKKAESKDNEAKTKDDVVDKAIKSDDDKKVEGTDK